MFHSYWLKKNVLIIIFVSSFLLFQIQPLISKFLSPFFGGSASVWTISVMFFQAFLLLWYLYAFLLSKLKLTKQFVLHTLLCIFWLVVVVYNYFVYGNPVIPLISNIDIYNPELFLLWVLSSTIWLQYFLLSSTSSLLQNWYYIAKNEQPYWFYKFSNLASLLALVSYPFIEPFFTVHFQWFVWGILFVGFVFLEFVYIYYSWFYSKWLINANLKTDNENIKKPWIRDYLLWLFFSCVPVIILLATTNKAAFEIASIPFIWIAFLCIYLITFIIWFIDNFYTRRQYIPLFLIFLLLLIGIEMSSNIIDIGIYLIFMLLWWLVFHWELYKHRPHPNYLTSFYLAISVWGVLWGVFVNFIAPMVFTFIFELYLSIVLSYFVCLYLLFQFWDKIKRLYLFLLIFLYLLFPVVFFHYAQNMVNVYKDNVIIAHRNFYWITKIKKVKSKYNDQIFSWHSITNWNTFHWIQYFNKEYKTYPTSYYSHSSWIWVTMSYFQTWTKVWIIWLWAWTIASYWKTWDNMVFYDINPIIPMLANKYFTYLTDSKADIEIVVWDGRLKLEEEYNKWKKRNFDVIVLDAFTSDSIPVHLLTSQALQSYLNQLKTDWIIAFHISNRHLDLTPIIAAIARQKKLSVVQLGNRWWIDFADSSSNWMLVTNNNKFLTYLTKEKKLTLYDTKVSSYHIWTDNYNSLIYSMIWD